jgi:hypothetical protein
LQKKQHPPPQNIPTPDQTKMYFNLLQMSHLFQMTLASAEIAKSEHRDISGYGAIGFFAGTAINENQPELDALAKEYVSDQPSFEAFTKTEGAHHFFIAMGLATEKLTKNSHQIQDLLTTAVQKHKNEWVNLYQPQAQH